MNYFSHYFFFRYEASPYRTLGMILPDIARFSAGKKAFTDRKLIKDKGKDFLEIFEGCALHYGADKAFHGSSLFHEMNSGISAILKEGDFNYGNMRKWFFDHVFMEMIFDRALIRKYDNIIAEFYDRIAAAESRKVVEFLQIYGRSGLEKFEYYYEGFCTSRFLMSYTNDQSFVQSLNRTMQKVEQPPAFFERLQPLLDPCEKFILTFENRVAAIMKSVHES